MSKGDQPIVEEEDFVLPPGQVQRSWPGHEERPPRSTTRWLILLVIVFLVAAAGEAIHPRYVVYRPGPVFDTLSTLDGDQLIEIGSSTTYPTTGSLDFTTVSLYGGPGNELSLWEYLQAKISMTAVTVPFEQVYSDQDTKESVKEESQAEMTGSQQEAVVNALRALGHTIIETTSVGVVSEAGPAHTLLRTGDQIVSVNGTALTARPLVTTLIQGTAAGEKVRFVVRRGGSNVTVDVPTVEVSVTDETGATEARRVVGISLTSTFGTLPVKVTINAGDVGGPSAGMMFALGIYDKLTPGALTGGQQIAGTGVIDSAGQVTAIGGITLKMIGARDAGARWFLAPAKNCTEVVGHVPAGLTVVKVATFAEARAAVGRIAAGDTAGLAGCG